MKKKFVHLTIAGVVAAGMIFLLRWQGNDLIQSVTPSGILALEFANTPEQLNYVLSFWNKETVRINIWIDFLFIIAYTWFFVLAIAQTASIWEQRVMVQFGATGIRLAFLAAMLDITENILMLQSINGHYTTSSLQLTWYCAAIKFAIVIVLLLYILLTIAFSLFKRNS